jgi:hypothetical protein
MPHPSGGAGNAFRDAPTVQRLRSDTNELLVAGDAGAGVLARLREQRRSYIVCAAILAIVVLIEVVVMFRIVWC